MYMEKKLEKVSNINVSCRLVSERYYSIKSQTFDEITYSHHNH